MSERCNGNIKRPKSQDTQPGILKIYAFCQKIQQRTLRSRRECCWHYLYVHSICLWEYTQKLQGKVPGRAQLEPSSHIVWCQVWCQGYMLTLQSLTYIEGNNRTCGPIWKYATKTGSCYPTKLWGSVHPCKL